MFSRRDFGYIAILMLAVGAWFHPFFLQGEMLVPPNATSAYPWYGTEAYTPPHPQGSMDAVRENYVSWAVQHEYMRKGYAPNWYPYILAGNPLLANQFSIPYSPFKLLNLVFSAALAWSWAIILKSFFNGLFTYLALRALRRSPPAALIGALAWMLSWALAHQTETTYSEGVALMPAVFFFTLRSYQFEYRRGQIAYGLAAAVMAGFGFLAGNIQMTIYAFLLLFGFAAYWSWANRAWRPLVTLILVYAGGALVGMAQIASSYELFTLSIRGVSQTHQNKGIEPYTSISFLNPWIYFWRNFEFPDLREKYWLTFRWNPYIGLIPLFGFGLGLRFVKDHVMRAVAVMSVGVYALLHVLYLRPVFSVVSGLPGYDVLEQARLLIVLPFPLAIIAAYGIDWFLDEAQKPENWQKLRPLLIVALGLVLFMGIGMAALMSFFAGEVEALPASAQTFAAQQTRTGTEILADYYHIKNPLFAMSFVFAVGGLVVVVGYARGQFSRRITEWLLIGLTAVDLVYFAQVNVASTQGENLYPVTPAIAFLQEQAKSDIFRITGAPHDLYAGRASGLYATYRDDHGWYLSSSQPVLMPNTAALFGLQDVRGYESVFTLKYGVYMARLDGQTQPFSAWVVPVNTVTSPMLDALNVRYVLAVEPLDDDSLNLVYDDEILIYENANALPRVILYDRFTVLDSEAAVLDAISQPDFDPAAALYFGGSPGFDLPPEADIAASGTASITRYEPNRVTVSVDTPADAVLLLADEHYPGWNAYVDGEKTLIATGNYLFRAVYIPAGAHTVEFRYESDVIRYAGWVSAVSFALLVVGMVVIGYSLTRS